MSTTPKVLKTFTLLYELSTRNVFTRVYADVVAVVRGAAESLSTACDWTRVGSLARMCAHVHLADVGRRERLATFPVGTLKRFLTCHTPHTHTSDQLRNCTIVFRR